MESYVGSRQQKNAKGKDCVVSSLTKNILWLITLLPSHLFLILLVSPQLELLTLLPSHIFLILLVSPQLELLTLLSEVDELDKQAVREVVYTMLKDSSLAVRKAAAKLAAHLILDAATQKEKVSHHTLIALSTPGMNDKVWGDLLQLHDSDLLHEYALAS